MRRRVSRAATAISRADAAVIAAPTDPRPALCVEAARAGRPLLVEEPVALSAGDARGSRRVGRSRTPALAALFLRELPALRPARGRAARAAGRAPRRRVGGGHTRARSTAGSAARAPGCATRRGPASAASGTSRCICSTRSRRSRGRAPGTGGGRARPPGTGAGTSAASRSAPGGARRSGCARAGRRGRRVRARRRGLRRHGDAARGRARARRGTGEPERWVGPPPDAGEALRAFAERLRARRFARDGSRRRSARRRCWRPRSGWREPAGRAARVQLRHGRPSRALPPQARPGRTKEPGVRGDARPSAARAAAARRAS